MASLKKGINKCELNWCKLKCKASILFLLQTARSFGYLRAVLSQGRICRILKGGGAILEIERHESLKRIGDNFFTVGRIASTFCCRLGLDSDDFNILLWVGVESSYLFFVADRVNLSFFAVDRIWVRLTSTVCCGSVKLLLFCCVSSCSPIDYYIVGLTSLF